MILTPNLSLKKPEGTDNVNIDDFNTNADILDAAVTAKETPIGAQAKVDAHASNVSHIPYAAATGLANAYDVTVSPVPTAYVEGLAVSVKINVDNTGASTINVNNLGAKSILKANGNALVSGNLKANSIYTMRYNGVNFILQGEGGEFGTANAPDVLTGKTIGTDAGLVTGTMPENGAVTLTPSGNGNVAIPAGHHNGSGIVSKVNVPASNVLTGTTIAGVAGSMPNRGAPTWTPGTGNQALAAGYYSGGTVLGDADLIAANILSGKNIFGIAGSVIQGQPAATGIASLDASSSDDIIVHGLSFVPDHVMAYATTGGGYFFSVMYYVYDISDPSVSITRAYKAEAAGGSNFALQSGGNLIDADGNFYFYSDGFRMTFGSHNGTAGYPNIRWVAVKMK